MYKSYKFEIYPNNEQKQKIWNNINGTRFAYNWTIQKRKDMHDNGIRFQSFRNELRNLFVTESKQLCDGWFKNRKSSPSSTILRNAIADANETYDRCGRKSKFRAKKNTNGRTFKDEIQKKNYFQLGVNAVYISKVGWVKLRFHHKLPLDSKLKNIRISFNGVKYQVSFCIEQTDENQVSLNKLQSESIGIDLGLKTFATCSNNKVFLKPDVSKIKKKLKRLQRKASKRHLEMKQQKKDFNKDKSKRLKKLELKILKLHKQISNILDNNLHQITSSLIKSNPKSIVIEDLKIKNMMKNVSTKEKIIESKFYTFREMLKYKCERNNIKLIVANMWYPSSKLCSNCKNIKHDLKLKDRVYRCDSCNLALDRDLNAALNLKDYEYISMSTDDKLSKFK